MKTVLYYRRAVSLFAGRGRCGGGVACGDRGPTAAAGRGFATRAAPNAQPPIAALTGQSAGAVAALKYEEGERAVRFSEQRKVWVGWSGKPGRLGGWSYQQEEVISISLIVCPAAHLEESRGTHIERRRGERQQSADGRPCDTVLCTRHFFDETAPAATPPRAKEEQTPSGAINAHQHAPPRRQSLCPSSRRRR